ncbi:transposase [Streptomyces sp. NPDC001982]|uniref:transposase n=1 Tax=Streptomyces sp. NPDC001982 TaxID=3154405 RepID=UPI0033345C4F
MPGADLVAKLVTIPGVGVRTAQILLAELGPDMTVFPTPDHLVSWAKFAPRTMQSGGKNTSGLTGKGNPWIKGAIGEAALSASRSNTFLGARYQRIVTPRPQESPGRRRPFTPGRRLAPAQRTRDSLHRPRLRLPPAPRRPHPPDPRPGPPAQSPRPRRHPRAGSLTSNPVQPLANDGRSLPWRGEIFRSDPSRSPMPAAKMTALVGVSLNTSCMTNHLVSEAIGVSQPLPVQNPRPSCPDTRDVDTEICQAVYREILAALRERGPLCTSHKPRRVPDALSAYHERRDPDAHRGLHARGWR